MYESWPAAGMNPMSGVFRMTRWPNVRMIGGVPRRAIGMRHTLAVRRTAMTKTRWAVIITVALVVGGDGRQEPVDAAANARIRDEGLNRSRVAEPFDMFVNVIGPRLTGSPSHKRAADYARATLEKWGMTNAHLEPWEFGRGWELEKLTIEMVEPRYMPLLGYAEAWTPSTPGELLVSAVSTAGKTADEIAALPIAGAAVL